MLEELLKHSHIRAARISARPGEADAARMHCRKSLACTTAESGAKKALRPNNHSNHNNVSGGFLTPLKPVFLRPLRDKIQALGNESRARTFEGVGYQDF